MLITILLGLVLVITVAALAWVLSDHIDASYYDDWGDDYDDDDLLEEEADEPEAPPLPYRDGPPQ